MELRVARRCEEGMCPVLVEALFRHTGLYGYPQVAIVVQEKSKGSLKEWQKAVLVGAGPRGAGRQV